MNQKLTAAIGAVLITAGLATASWAVQLQTMLQGYLTNTSGTPFTGPQAAEFKVYQGGSPTTAGSGTLAYDETATVTPAASGVFNYMLGSGTPVSPVLLVGGQAVANVISTGLFASNANSTSFQIHQEQRYCSWCYTRNSRGLPQCFRSVLMELLSHLR